MRNYEENCKESLLPLSVSNIMSQAVKEWKHEGKFVDHLVPSVQCELCGKKGLRYHFGIENDQTDEELMVGSQCIKRFEIGIKGIRKFDESEYDTYFYNMRQQAFRDIVKGFIEKTLQRETEDWAQDALEGSLSRLERKGKLTPAQTDIVLWRSEEVGLTGEERERFEKNVTVDLNRKKYKRQVKKLEDWKLQRMMGCFSKTQKDIVKGYRN